MSAFETHQAQVIANFSGVLSVDEAFSGDHVLLLATDPLQNLTIASEVTDSNDTKHIAAFLQKLVDAGLVPDLVITDEHKAYPKALKQAFGDIRHALCRFHFTKKLTGAVIDVVGAIAKDSPEVEAKTIESLVGDAPQGARKTPMPPSQAQGEELNKGKYLMVKRQEKLDEDEAGWLEIITERRPCLGVLRGLILGFYAIFEGEPIPAVARRRRDSFVSQYSGIEHAKVRMYVRQLADDKIFERLVAPLYYLNGPRTTNDTEQENRVFKKRMKHSYRLRTVKSIECWLRRRMRSQKPQLNPLLKRFGPKAGLPALQQHRT